MLHTDAVSPATLGLLKELMQKNELRQFCLVGGTALALQLGHRISVDIDLFTTEKFNVDDIEKLIQQDYPGSMTQIKVSDSSLIITINEVKTDFIRYRYPIIDALIVKDGIAMYGKKDIAAMKLAAISQRGEKKDFYDIYYLLNDFTFSEMLMYFEEKFQQTELFHIIKSITYFEDADNSFDVISLHNLKWKDVKTKILSEAKKIKLT
jgi:predicted nucleotidyltransferase component of viral defense system